MSYLNKNNEFSENKQEVFSITYEEIGFFPRSFSRVLDRFLKQVFSDVENLVIQEYRFYRYLFLTTLKCLLILFFVPFFVHFLTKTYIVRPLTEYFWNTKQTEIFLNSYQQKRAFSELKEFEEKTYFESLIFPKSVFTPSGSLAVVFTPNMKEPPSVPVGTVSFTNGNHEEKANRAFGTLLVSQEKDIGENTVNVFVGNTDMVIPTSEEQKKESVRPYLFKNQNGEDNKTELKDKNFLFTSSENPISFVSTPSCPSEQPNCTSMVLNNSSQNGFFFTAEPNSVKRDFLYEDSPIIAGEQAVEENNIKFIIGSLNQSITDANAQIKENFVEQKKSNNVDEHFKNQKEANYNNNNSIVEKAQLNLEERGIYEKSSLFVYQTQEADKNIQKRYQEKTIELAQRYNDQSIEAITNFFADLISLLTLIYLLYALEIQINITKSFLLEVFFGLDDSKKSLLILLITDLLVGYHSSNLWELFFEFLFHHYGLPESQTGIFLLVATLPVLLDVLFKYLIFRHLNRSSPATVATYHAMIE